MKARESGGSHYVTGVGYPQPFDRLAVELCRGATRHVCIQSPLLDHAVFDNPELTEVLSALARSSRQTRVRVLVADARPMVRNGHRLLALARRIPSVVEIRRLPEHQEWNGETLVIRDRDGHLYKPAGSDREGFFEIDSRAATRKHLELFEELWRQAVEDTELRRLSL